MKVKSFLLVADRYAASFVVLVLRVILPLICALDEAIRRNLITVQKERFRSDRSLHIESPTDLSVSPGRLYTGARKRVDHHTDSRK